MHRILLALGLTTLVMPTDAATLRYHGELLDRSAPANARYDLRLTPYADAGGKQALASAVTFEDVLVEDGFFLLEPDFGAGILDHHDVWIELAVRDADSTLGFAAIQGREKAVLAPLVGQCWTTTGDSGVSAATNFLGTTDGAPLVLRSSGGIGINTSDPRDLLTLRGPSSYLDGPTINLTGTTSDQAESGRIRFVEGTATGNFRGAYVRYDGANNVFAIGAHNNSDNLPASDVDQIVMLRSATTRVGIGRSPEEELDVDGDIRVNGGVKYANVAQHSLMIHSSAFSEMQDNDCTNAVDLRKNSNFGAGNCGAVAPVSLPDKAVIHALSVRFSMGNGTSTGDCTVALKRREFTETGDVTEIASVSGVGSAGVDFVLASNLNTRVNTDLHADFLEAISRETTCGIGIVRIVYTLPDGFIP